jgi:hypothetical protein
LGETTKSVSKRPQSQKILRGLEARGIVKVSKLVENGPVRQEYWTETVDISVHGEDGRRLFQSFYIIAVPEGQMEGFERLRKQMRKSLVSCFEECVHSLRRNEYPQKRIE